MAVDIAAAEKVITDALPAVIELAGEINTKGTFLVFDSIDVKEAVTSDINYVFKVFVSIASKTKNKRLLYAPVNEALSGLIAAIESGEKLIVGRITPHAIKGLIVYQIIVTVEGFKPHELD